MRPESELDFIATQATATSQGTCPIDILAFDAAERDWLIARLRGRHGVKAISVRMADPAEARSIHARFAA